MKHIIVSILVMFFFYQGCRSSKTPEKEQEQIAVQEHGESNTTVSTNMPPPPPSAIKPNLTFIGALVDSVVLLDSMNYRIFFYVNTAIPEGGLESIAEAGQRISAVPSYVVSEQGLVDMSHERNKRLFRLREAVAEDVFIGKISLTDKRGWVIVDVDAFK